MEERPKTPSVVSLSCERLHSDEAFQPRRPGALRRQTGSNRCPARVTARSAIRTPIRSSACLYTRFCGASLPRAFPARLRLRPRSSSFSEPTTHRVSGEAAHLELARPSCGLPCGSPRRTNAMRTTDFCFPLPDYEYPRLVSYRRLFEACASPLANGLAPATRRPVDLAFHDAGPASVGPPGLARSILTLRDPDRAEPLTPQSLPGVPLRAFA